MFPVHIDSQFEKSLNVMSTLFFHFLFIFVISFVKHFELIAYRFSMFQFHLTNHHLILYWMLCYSYFELAFYFHCWCSQIIFSYYSITEWQFSNLIFSNSKTTLNYYRIVFFNHYEMIKFRLINVRYKKENCKSLMFHF